MYNHNFYNLFILEIWFNVLHIKMDTKAGRATINVKY